MNRNDIIRLFDFDAWATDKMFSVVETLSREQYERDLGSSFGGVRGTTTHIHLANWIWLQRWKGTNPASIPELEQELATFSALREREIAQRSEVRRFVEGLTEETLQSPWPYKTIAGAPYAQILADQMQHVVNHSTYHRGQVITMLRQLGAPAIGTDLIAYVREVSG